MTKPLTELQTRFLDALAGEAKGDLKQAKKLAGYSETTMVNEIVKGLKDEIIEVAKDLMAHNVVKAVHGLLDTVDSPGRVGANHAVSAAKELLDRAGLVKPESGQSVTLPTGAIIMLPDKKPVDVE